MESKFQTDAVLLGRSANAVKLGTILTFGRFWVRQAGCHTVYAGQDGNMDYDTVQAVMELADSQVAIVNQSLPADTIWHYVRRQVSDCGLESDDSAPVCIVRVDASGDAIGLAPNRPKGLTATALAGGLVKLRWRYSTLDQPVAAANFNIYLDSGSGFDFDTPYAVVAAPASLAGGAGTDRLSWTSTALSHGQRYRFCVRSESAAGGETQNTDSVAIVADSVGPDAITDLRSSWQEI